MNMNITIMNMNHNNKSNSNEPTNPLFVLCGFIFTTELATTTTTIVTVSIAAISLHLLQFELGGLIMITIQTPTSITMNLPLLVLCGSIITTELATTTTTTIVIL